MTDFAIRIFSTDHYLSKPLHDIDFSFNDFTNKHISQVPIIRVFGSTPKGQKVCAHIHGVYPYFYVPFFEDISIILNKDRLDKFLLNFSSSLSTAISLSMNSNVKYDLSHIFRITLVKGKPFYGYQEQFQYFLKIYLYNPFHVKKAGDLLLNGAVMNRSIQPYETHIPYNLKFFIDYNLYGMNYLYTDTAKFRVSKNYFPEGSFIDLDVSDSLDLSQKTWNIDQLPPDCMMDERICSKSSFCELEVDICACDILNIQEVQKNIGQNPGLKDLWEEEKQRRIKLGLNLEELVGEVFEDRQFAVSAESEAPLLEEWRDICSSVNNDVVLSQDVDDFIGASPPLAEEVNDEEEWEVDESVNEDSVKEALRTGDSFVRDAVESNKDVNNEDDREMQDFINACIKLEEEDSIIQDRQSDTSSVAPKDILTKKCPSFSQHTVINLSDEESECSDEDLFNQTFIDLSIDGEGDDTTTKSDRRKRNVSSDDLFDDDSVDIDSDSSQNCGIEIIKTHDGADDSNESDGDGSTANNKRRKIDPKVANRTPVVTRSKLKLDSKGQLIKPVCYAPEAQKTKKPRIRKQRPSLAIKNFEELSNKSVTSFRVVNMEMSAATNNNSRNKMDGTTPKCMKVQGTSRLSNNEDTDEDKEEAEESTQQRSTAGLANFSTPLRSNMAPLSAKFSDISPITKSSTNSCGRQRSVSFSIPEMSQEMPVRRITCASQASQQLETLEYMKKTVSLGLQEKFKDDRDFLSQRFHASMVSHVTLISAELHCSSQSNLRPNPSTDPVLMFFYSVYHEPDCNNESMASLNVYEEGVIYVDETGDLLSSTGVGCSRAYRTVAVANEAALFDQVIELVMKFDPDILVGYETTRSSWGYVIERSYSIKHRLYYDLGRLQNEEKKLFKNKECSFNELHCSGRVILDLWIIMKHEVTLTSYTLENVVDDVLKERVPFFTNQQLMAWYRSSLERYRVINYWKYRVTCNLRLLSKLDVISRASEFAKIYGIEFYHVLSRGSQYRVEAMMLRLAKPQNLIALSPSVQQRARQRAPECIPLVLEPKSGFYKDPVVVLDFQSLYPSIMIAYNYCYSTSLGKLPLIKDAGIGESFAFGCGKLTLDESTIKNVRDDVTVSPNEVVFVKSETFKGIVSKMVEEILTTRIMVKKSMKIHKNDKGLCKLLDSRQLGLKLIANVTYGYTAAGFSGRMPCVEIGESIIRKSRETLERAIELVKSGGPEGYSMSDEAGGWAGCSVIYGDTDSMFVLMPGRTKQQAFTLGERIADAVTATNPFPVKLKFEKVFLPCLLESKKRYVGYSYETLDQQKPKFDAKGIETVRRDNCNIVSRILERTLLRLFDMDPLESIRKFVIRELEKVLSNKVNMIDFIIAKEYRGRQTYRHGASVPALHIANELRKRDPRSEPLPGERVQYVIVQGGPGDTLLSCVRQPCDLLFNTKILKSYGNNIRSLSEQGCQLSYIYYITKQILPPLHRALCLVGLDVFKWYAQMPKRCTVGSVGRPGSATAVVGGTRNRTIASYFLSQKCLLCDKLIKHNVAGAANQMSAVLCDACLGRGGPYIYYCATQQMKDIEDVRLSFLERCNLCVGTTAQLKGVGPPCVSTDCPLLYDRIRACQQSGDELERLLQSDIF